MIKVYTGRDTLSKRQWVYGRIEGPVTVITPEQSTLQVESSLIEEKKAAGLLDIQVTSFTRLLTRVQNVFLQEQKPITPMGKTLLFRYILEDLQEELLLFSASSKGEGFMEELRDTVDFFLREGVKISDLEDVMEKTPQHLLKKKVQDLITIFKEYENRISQGYLLTEMAIELLKEHAFTYNLVEKQVWILGYKAFDAQQLQIIDILQKQAHVHLVLPFEKDEELYEVPRLTLEQLKEMDPHLQVIEITSKKTPFDNFSYNLVMEEELFTQGMELRLFQASYMEEEVEFVGLDILKKKAEEPELCAKDFQLVVSDDTYMPLVSRVFRKLGIPVYTDEREPLIGTRPVKNLLSLLRVFWFGFQPADVLEFMKGIVLPDQWDYIDLFENTVFTEGWTYKDVKNPEYPQELEPLFVEYVKPLLEREGFFSKKHLPKEFGEELFRLLKDLHFEERLEKEGQRLYEEGSFEEGEVLSQVYETLVEISQQIPQVSRKVPITFFEYSGLLQYALKDISVAKLPQSQEMIHVATVTRSFHQPCSYLYILGVNDEKLPRVYEDSGLFSEKQRAILRGKGYPLLSSIYTKESVARLDEFTLMALAQKEIVFTYSSLDQQGGSLLPSMYVDRLIQSGVPIQSSLMNQDYLKNLYFLNPSTEKRYIAKEFREKGEGDFYYNDDSTPELMGKIHQKEATEVYVSSKEGSVFTSVSRLEEYFQCPFKYFVRYELKPFELREFEIDSLRKGILYHQVLEESVETLVREPEKQTHEVVGEILRKALWQKQYAPFFKNEKSKFLTDQMEKELSLIVKALMEKLKDSSFTPKAFEKEVVASGENYKIRGVIDRVDETEKDFVITDYKTYEHPISVQSIEQGEDLQLILYLDAYASLSKKNPKGMYYLRLYYPYAREKGGNLFNPSQEFTLNGFFIGSEGEASSYHRDEGEQGSEYMGVKFKKDGTFTKTSKVLTKAELKNLMSMAKEKADETAVNIRKGDRSIYPFQNDHRSACQRCDYAAVCRFVPGKFVKGYRKLKKSVEKEKEQEVKK